MRRVRWLAAAVAALALAGGLPKTVRAANANNPYGNIDPRNDAGNDTGDSQVDELNRQQLNENYRGPYYYGSPPPPGVRPPPGPPPYAGQPYPPPPLRPPGYPLPGYRVQPPYPPPPPPPGYPPPGY